MSDFQKTVDLKERLGKEKPRNAPAREAKKPARPAPKKNTKKAEPREMRKPKRSYSIDEVYNNDDDGEAASGGDLKIFNRPLKNSPNDSIYKVMTMTLVLILALTFAYFLFFNNIPEQSSVEPAQTDSGWYAVKLANDQMYYGQVEDKSADPLVIKNVYYNYDQLNKEENAGEESGNLRLVKRGKETHGPDGTMSIIRSQVVFFEPLKEDSKVLKAILDYEK